MFQSRIQPEDIQYMGRAGDSMACLLAVDTIVNSQNPPRKASVVTHVTDRRNWQREHLLLFWDWNALELAVVHSGFTSGYGGEGPRTFSEALCMLSDRKIPTNEIYVDELVFQAIEHRRLTTRLIESLRSADAGSVEEPWHAIWERHQDEVEAHAFWQMRHQPKPDFDFLDPELTERCQTLYPANVQAAIREAYLVVEERLRSMMSGLDDSGDILSGDKLLVKALHPETGNLTDKSLPRSEREGLFLMSKGAYQFVRNPRSHRIVDENDAQLAIELLYQADLLLRLLAHKSPDSSSAP